MKTTAILELDFLLLLASSLVAPIAIYVFLFRKRAISRWTVLVFASLLIGLSGMDVFLLKVLGQIGKASLGSLEGKLFSSELSMALYVLPAVFAGVGINLISHVLIDHLVRAEQRFDHEHASRRARDGAGTGAPLPPTVADAGCSGVSARQY
jgi:hypothetical protein